MPQNPFAFQFKNNKPKFVTTTKGIGNMSFTPDGGETKKAQASASASASAQTLYKSIERAEGIVNNKITQSLRDKLITTDSSSEMTIQFQTSSKDESEPLELSTNPDYVGVLFRENNEFQVYSQPDKQAGTIKVNILIVGKGGNGGTLAGQAGGGGGGSVYLQNTYLVLSTDEQQTTYKVTYSNTGDIMFSINGTDNFIAAHCGQPPSVDTPSTGGLGGLFDDKWPVTEGFIKIANKGGNGGFGDPNPHAGFESTPYFYVPLPFYNNQKVTIGGGGGGSTVIQSGGTGNGCGEGGRGQGGSVATQSSLYNPSPVSSLGTGYGGGGGGLGGIGSDGICMLWYENKPLSK
jgi:hypothetical protein